MVPLLLGIATATELLGALFLLVGFRVKLVAIALFLIMLPTTLVMHTFWNMEGMMFQAAMMDFIQNMAIMGGLLALAAVTHLFEKEGKLQVK